MRDDMIMTGTGNGGTQARVARWSVPGYTEVKKLGSGGFGDVVLARHDASGTRVAIKYLKAELLADPEFAESFRGEADVLASLDDPNVVRLYEYAESPSGAAIVMELVDGVSLRQILKGQGATTPEAALVVLHGSLMGLAAAHARGVVHRDYKPDNVLIGGDGGSKLTDFGIAARAWDRPLPAGTLIYAPPEQFAGGPASPATDVYAATATFFECLTGQPPFRGNTAEALLYQHMSQPVPVDAVPEPVRPLVAAGLAKQPEDRPADAATFVAALSTIAAGAYGPDWRERGRSHLGEAALLLAALWPSGAAPAVQGTTVARTPLRASKRRTRLRHAGTAKAAIAAGTAIVVAASGAFLASALTRSHSAALPAVTGVSPASGSTAGGTTLAITGTGLASATSVRFGGARATITADSSTQITVTSPPGHGTVTISVTTPGGTSKTTDAGHYTYTTRPERTQAISFGTLGAGSAGGWEPLEAIGGGSGNPVVFSVDPASTPGACTVSGTTVTLTGGGTCVIDANQAGADGYAQAPQVQRTITIGGQPVIGTPVSGNPVSGIPQGQPKTAPPAPARTPARTQTPAVTQAPTQNPAPPPTVAQGPAPAPTATATPPPGPGTPGGSTVTGWTAGQMPLPANAAADPDVGFGTVACASASSCVATDSYTDSSGGKQGLLVTGSGTSWTATEAPLPANAAADPDVGLGSVACPSASSCVVPGEYTDSSGLEHVLLLTGSGTSWTATEVPLPANADDAVISLASVACSSASSCVAAGSATDPSGNGQMLLVTGSGTSWTAAEVPPPANAAPEPDLDLASVACPSASSCVAAGSYFDASGGEQGLLVTGSGTSWTATEAPLPANAAADPMAELSSVACPSASSCVAAGGYSDSSGDGQALLLTGSGTSWTATEAPLPASAANPGGGLGSVVCPSVSSCVAVGGYNDASGEEHALLLTGSGTSWTAAQVPAPANAGAEYAGTLTSVACTSASSCVVAGQYIDSSNMAEALTVTGPGASWTAAGPTPPATANTDRGVVLTSVACASASSCVATGGYFDSSGHEQGLLVTGAG